jgi:hypothetical protein
MMPTPRRNQNVVHPASRLRDSARLLDELLHDRQADAGATQGTIARLLHPVEALPDVGQVVGRDPRTGVGDLDRDTDSVGAPRGFDEHPAARGRVPHSVLEEVAQDLGELVRAAPNDQGVVDRDGQVDGVARQRRGHEIGGGAHDRRQLDRAGDGALALAAGEDVERRGEAGEPVHLLAERVEGGGVRRQDSVAERLQVALQVRERSPELVGGVHHELPGDVSCSASRSAIAL